MLEKGVQNIKEEIGYSGQLILSSIMPDKLLLDPKTLEEFKKTARTLGFDALLAWDMPVYIDAPEERAWRNLEKSLQAIEALKTEGYSIIPLVKGNTYKQILHSASRIAELGYNAVALHVTEYMQAIAGQDYKARAILSMHLDILYRLFDTILLVGALTPTAIRYIDKNWPHRSQKLAFAGLSWLLDAKRKRAYTAKRVHSLLEKTVKPPKQQPLTHNTPTPEIAEHNLSRATMAAKKQKNIDRVYDAYTEPPILVIADIHLGRPDACIQAAIQTAKETRPKTLVLLGDIYDLHHEITLHHIAMLHSLASMAETTITLIGDAEQPGTSHRRLIETLDRLALQDKPWTAPPEPPEPAHSHILSFYRYLRTARQEATTILPDGTTIAYTHGHTLQEKDIRLTAKRAQLFRLRKKADHAVIAHLHKPRQYPELGVTITGHSLKAPTRPAYTLIEDNKPTIIHPPRDACTPEEG